MAQQCLPFDQIVNYTCSTEATYIGREPDGFGGYNYVIKTAQPNEPRFPYDPETGKKLGLLNEPSSENLFLHSEDFTQSAWTKGRLNISSNATESPRGTVGANKLVATSVSGTHYLIQSYSTFEAGKDYTFSAYVKKDELSRIRMTLPGTAFPAGQGVLEFDASSGQIISVSAKSSEVKKIRDFYRVSVTATADASVSGTADIFLRNENGDLNFTGDDVKGLFLWGAQLEQLSFASSYIPTTTSSAVREQSKSIGSLNGVGSHINLFFEGETNEFVYDSGRIMSLFFIRTTDAGWGTFSGIGFTRFTGQEPITVECRLAGSNVFTGINTGFSSGKFLINVDRDLKTVKAYANGSFVGERTFTQDPFSDITTFDIADDYAGAARDSVKAKKASVSFEPLTESESLARTTPEDA